MNKLLSFITTLLLARAIFTVEYDEDDDNTAIVIVDEPGSMTNLRHEYKFDLTEDDNVPKNLPKLEC